MALDHYVSQVHLKQFLSPTLPFRMRATKKSDLKSFECRPKDVCRIENGSTNAYLLHDRAVEDFLREVEPNYDESLEKLRTRAIDQKCIATFAGFTAYVMSCAPAAMRTHTKLYESRLQTTATILDRQGMFGQSPPSLGSKSMTELLAEGAVRFNVDRKYPQAVGISTIQERMSVFGNSRWEVLVNDFYDCPFFSSDYPIALERKDDNRVNWVSPIAPDIAIRIVPDVSLSRAMPDLSFERFSCRYVSPSRSEIVDLNRLLVRCAEDMIFYRDDLPWIAGFIKNNRNYKVDMLIERMPNGRGFVEIAAQRIVAFDRGANSSLT